MSGGSSLSDEFDSLIFEDSGERQSGEPKVAHPAAAPVGIVEYNEACYVTAYPDVQEALDAGRVTSAIGHYEQIGRAEYRLASPNYIRTLAGGNERASHGAVSFNLDVVIASTTGTIFIVGWSDDRSCPLLSISIVQGSEGWNTRAVARCRRTDVEELLQAPPGPLYGFWAVHKLGRFDNEHPAIMLRARFADGQFTQTELTPRVVPEFDLREIILGHFASLSYLGNRDIESYQQLEIGAGAELVALNRSISATIKASAYIEHYGPLRTRFAASFIVCLFGKSEYFFLQSALFSTGTGVADVEFIYVSNSPELTETLRKEARISELIYGLSITLVTLTGNAGFSAANNVAAGCARSDRVVFVNPDVFPIDNGWAATHAAILASKPAEQTRLFGAPLYYDDGSLMHGGMYFERDVGLSVKPTEIKSSGVIRVEHYGKGAPAWSDRYTAARPVPAVTGAFISADRGWFESLGGLTEDYLFGHYEDADLCLKSLQKGTPAWLQDVRFWHMEGKGSTRRPPHEGGSLVNRWLFTRRWGAFLQDGLLGRAPSHPLLSNAPASTGSAAAPAPVAAASALPPTAAEPTAAEPTAAEPVRPSPAARSPRPGVTRPLAKPKQLAARARQP